MKMIYLPEGWKKAIKFLNNITCYAIAQTRHVVTETSLNLKDPLSANRLERKCKKKHHSQNKSH